MRMGELSTPLTIRLNHEKRCCRLDALIFNSGSSPGRTPETSPRVPRRGGGVP